MAVDVSSTATTEAFWDDIPAREAPYIFRAGPVACGEATPRVEREVGLEAFSCALLVGAHDLDRPLFLDRREYYLGG